MCPGHGWCGHGGCSTGTTACVLASWRCALWGWREGVPGGGALRRCEGCLRSGARPLPAARPQGGLSGSAAHLLWMRVLLLYLGNLVEECNCPGENNGTGSRAHEVLQLSFCLLWTLRRGPCDNVLRYERTIMCTLPYSSKWRQDLPGQAHSEEFGQGMLSKLVRDKTKTTGSITAEEVENHYLLLQVGPGGKRVGVQKVIKILVQRMRQRLTRYLAADRIYRAYVEWKPQGVSTLATSWPRGLRRLLPSPTQPLNYDHYWLLAHSVLDALIDQKTNPTNQLKRKLDAVVGRRTDMNADRQEAATRNVRQRVR